MKILLGLAVVFAIISQNAFADSCDLDPMLFPDVPGASDLTDAAKESMRDDFPCPVPSWEYKGQASTSPKPEVTDQVFEELEKVDTRLKSDPALSKAVTDAIQKKGAAFGDAFKCPGKVKVFATETKPMADYSWLEREARELWEKDQKGSLDQYDAPFNRYVEHVYDHSSGDGNDPRKREVLVRERAYIYVIKAWRKHEEELRAKEKADPTFKRGPTDLLPEQAAVVDRLFAGAINGYNTPEQIEATLRSKKITIILKGGDQGSPFSTDAGTYQKIKPTKGAQANAQDLQPISFFDLIMKLSSLKSLEVVNKSLKSRGYSPIQYNQYGESYYGSKAGEALNTLAFCGDPAHLSNAAIQSPVKKGTYIKPFSGATVSKKLEEKQEKSCVIDDLNVYYAFGSAKTGELKYLVDQFKESHCLKELRNTPGAVVRSIQVTGSANRLLSKPENVETALASGAQKKIAKSRATDFLKALKTDVFPKLDLKPTQYESALVAATKTIDDGGDYGDGTSGPCPYIKTPDGKVSLSTAVKGCIDLKECEDIDALLKLSDTDPVRVTCGPCLDLQMGKKAVAVVRYSIPLADSQVNKSESGEMTYKSNQERIDYPSVVPRCSRIEFSCGG